MTELTAAEANPKLFVSYSWTSPDHETWVLNLATEVRESGVDVILDKWDLKEGNDAHAFMEKMVTDPEIKKVILICDRAYVDKADGRMGGVGTEAQIISGEIYARQNQNKFVAIVRECTEDGKPCLPAYYRSRIYIDMSDEAIYAESVEKLLRWVYDKPLNKKPEIGKRPAFLSEVERAISLSTSFQFKRAIDAIRNGREHAIGATREYFDTLAGEFKNLELDANIVPPFDDAVVQSIESFLPYRDEVISVFISLALYKDTEETRGILHKFFEQMLPFTVGSERATEWQGRRFDNYRFIVHELFLYAIACLIRHERFDSAAYLMNNGYFFPARAQRLDDPVAPFQEFYCPVPLLDERNKRLQLRHLSLRANLLETRCKGIGMEFRDLIQADFVLFLRDSLDCSDDLFKRWWPVTLVYAERCRNAFEIFARSRSSAYFDRVKVLLAGKSKNDLESLLAEYRDGRRKLPRWDFESFDPAILLGFDKLATQP